MSYSTPSGYRLLNGILVSQTTHAQAVELIGGGGSGVRVVDEFTRPADTTAYTIGDVIAATTSDTATTPLRSLALAAASARPFRLTGWSVAFNKTDFLPTIRVHLFSVPNPAAASGTAVVGDNTAMVQKYNNLPLRFCAFDLPACALQHVAGDDLTYASRFEDLDIEIAPTDQNVYYRYEITAGSSITPSSGMKAYTRAHALWL